MNPWGLNLQLQGPFRIISRAPTFFVIDYNGHEARVAIERIKAAHELPIPFFQKENYSRYQRKEKASQVHINLLLEK